MNFLIFLWNNFVRFIWFISFIIFEILVFGLIIKGVNEAGLYWLSGILTIVFIIWIILEILLKIFVGGTKSLIRYIFRF